MSIETIAGGAWFGGWNEIGALNLLIVQSGTPNSGVFLYSGVPALGNGPIFWATTNTTDPYGNTVTPTVGVAASGRFNAGNTIINANGQFGYSGTPSASNLIASVCPVATTDPFGTAAVAGFANYSNGIQSILNQSGLILTWVAGAGGPSTPAPTQPGNAQVGVPLSNAAQPNLAIAGPTANANLVTPQITLQGGSQDGTATPNIFVQNSDNSALPVTFSGPVTHKSQATPATPSGAATLYADTNNRFEQMSPSGRHAVLSDGSGESANRTVTQATATAITANWSFPGGDANAGTMYRITAFGYGTWGSTAQNLSVETGLNGSAARTETVASSLFPINTAFEWNAVYTLFVTSTGVGGSCWLICTFTISAVGGSHGAQQLTFVVGSHSGLPETLNTTVANTMQLMMSWASTTGAPTVTCVGSTFERVGT